MKKHSIALLFPLFACVAHGASFTNGQAARAVIGQLDFTFGEAFAACSDSTPPPSPCGTSQWLLGGPSGLAYANGMLWVADSNVVGATASNTDTGVNNNRVLMYYTSQIPPPYSANVTQYANGNSYCAVCGHDAHNVLGEPDYNSQGPQTVSAQSLNVPTAVATDGNILAVADTNNNRILIWNSIPLSIDQAANVVLGSSNFTTPGQPIATQTNLRGPQGVWIQNGKLFVADTQNYRVLIWNSIPTSNNQPADLVLGQPSFTSGTQPGCNPTKSSYTAAANEFCNPVSVTSDGTHLFVADLAFNRVLIWNSIPTSNDQPADVVIGQPDMVSAVPNNPAVCGGASECAASLNYPRYALSNGTQLFIADGGNDRVLIFNSIPTSNGASANNVLGQPDFSTDVDTSTNAPGSSTVSIASTAIDNTGSVDTIPSPMSLAWDGQNLYVSDPFNRRVLVFTPGDTSLADNSVVNWASQIIRQQGFVSVSLPATTGAIVANDTVSISIGLASAASPTTYTYTVQKTDTLDSIAQGLVSKINANGGDPNVTAIFAGTGTATVYLVSKAVNLGFDAISLSATTSNSADIAATASRAYLTSGTAATGAAGMLVLISGSNLSDNAEVANLSQTLPGVLGGVQVFMDGIETHLLSVSPTQIVAQIPYAFTNDSGSNNGVPTPTATDRNSISIYVRTAHNDGSVTITNATPMYLAGANPGLFTTGPGQPLAPAAGAYHQPGNPTAVISIDGTVTAGDTVTITVNGRNYTYTVVSGDTLTSIAQNLVNLIAGHDPQVTASLGGAYSRVVLTALQPGAAGTGIPVSGSASSSATETVTAYTGSTCCDAIPGSPISATNPAGPGEMITLTGAGLGVLDVGSPAGVPFSGPEPNNVQNSVSATMSGNTAQVIFSGLQRGAIGTYAIQMIVPSDTAAGSNTQVYIAQNAFISNTVTVPVGTPEPYEVAPPVPPQASSLIGNIDSPSAQSGVFSGSAQFGGWMLDKKATVTGVTVSIDGVSYGAATYGGSRPDVCAIYPSAPNCSSNDGVGWSIVVDTTKLADGTHTLDVTASSTDGLYRTLSASFATANASPSNPTHVSIDSPSSNSNPFQGSVIFIGWAINNSSPITSVTVSVDDTPVGSATYGSGFASYRPDVCTLYPSATGCPAGNVGWSILVDTNKFSNGSHTLTVSATAANGQYAAVAKTFTVENWSTANPMIINIDAPSSNAGAFSGTSVLFGGWAIDSNAAIASVHIAIDGVSYGNATYGVVRSDVCAAYKNAPGCPHVGWDITFDSTVLADGAHTLAVTATTVTGQSSTVTRSFSVANLIGSNPLRVDIDVPGPNNPTVSSSAVFSGWALSTNEPNTTVEVLIDGVPSGLASKIPRPDVCARFSSPDCPNVGWTYTFDTTLLANGTHTLEVTATSSSGQRGSESRSFTVANTISNSAIQMNIQWPKSPSDPLEGVTQFLGWAFDTKSGVTVSNLTVAIDGVPDTAAVYGVSRPDVCATYASSNPQGCPNVGWTLLLDTTQISDGTHTLDVTAYASDGTHLATSTTFQVGNWSTPSPTTIDIDNPSTNLLTDYTGTVTFGGWALDQSGPISSISVTIDGVPFPGAIYGISRPDVCKVYPSGAGCPNVGWAVLINTSLVSNGIHTLAVTATNVLGQYTTVSRSFIVAN